MGIMSISPPFGIGLAFAEEQGGINLSIALLMTALWIMVTLGLLCPKLRSLAQAVTVASRPEVLEEKEQKVAVTL